MTPLGVVWVQFEAGALYSGVLSGGRQAQQIFHNKWGTSTRKNEELSER